MPISAVIETIDSLHTLHQALLQLGEDKRGVLVNNKVNELAAIVNQENKLLKQVTQVEAQWREAIATLVKSAGLQPNPSLTVSDIMQLVKDPADRQRLQDAQQRLLDVIGKIRSTNENNQKLIEQSLAYINYSIDLYTGGFGQEPVYGNPAKNKSGATAPRGKKNAIFDTRA